MDVELLSRLQFAGTVMFHYIFPPLTIGLGIVLVLLEGAWLRTRNDIWHAAAKFWTKVFALNFALGVASGIVMEFQFGTNWAAYSRFVGDVFGSALAAEGIFAFFLESGFLAVLVFGWDRVGPKMHFFSTCMVALGSIFSAVWIVVANSWQQTPAGYHIVETGALATPFRAEVTSFWAMVFNPSSVDRLTHVLIGAFVLGGFFVMSVSAYYILKNRHFEFARRSFIAGLILALIASYAALLTGHDQAKKVAQTQPAKLAAFEGLYHTPPEGQGADLYLFGWPDDESKTVKGGIAIPGMLSFLLDWDTTAPVPGLDKFHEDDTPPVWLTFQMYHLMIALGMFFIALTTLCAILGLTGTLWNRRWLLWIIVLSVPLPFIANQAGWIAAEVGRQPWVVYPSIDAEVAHQTFATPGATLPRLDPDTDAVVHRGLRTKDALSESVPGSQVLGSIIMFALIYGLLFIVWLYVLNSKIQGGPEDTSTRETASGDFRQFFRIAKLRADPAGASMTQARTRHDSAEGDR